MNCHSQMWVGSRMLEPVRASYATDRSIEWQRVYNLPGFVYFDHGIHVQKGIGCSSCHGQLDRMPFTYQAPTLLMKWCLDCHRDPAKEIRPREQVFNVNYQRPADQAGLGRELVVDYKIRSAEELTSCTACHR
jgi:cytochrome c peroxidase